MGEILVEIMRDRPDSPLGRPGIFKGPYPSGAPAIFISAAARLGHEARIWAAGGDDPFGRMIKERLIRDGVDCRSLVLKEGRSTGAAFVSYDSSGGREFIFHIDRTPAGEALFLPAPDEGEIPRPDWFHVMGCSLMVNHGLHREILRAAEYCRQGGAKISFDPNIRPELLGSRSARDMAGPVMDGCSLFMPGEEELTLFGEGTDTPRRVASLWDRYDNLETVVVKKGSRGADIYTRTEQLALPPYDLGPAGAVDPTGAGDMFDAAFLTSLAEGRTLGEAGERAARAGGLNAAAWGPMEGDLSFLI